MFVLDTAGDPTIAPDGPRVYQLGFMGPPGRSVGAVFPNTNVLDGTRQVLHLRQDPGAPGETTYSTLWSDFGARRLGP